MDEPSILVSQGDDKALIRVLGRGSFKNARHVKCYADKLLERGTTHFILDLQECTHMDSTFMGMLAGLSVNLRKNNGTPPQIVNASPRNLELLQGLGLDRVLDIPSEPLDLSTIEFSSVKPEEPGTSKKELTKTMLEAHENLLEVDKKNAPKFQDVITYLREELGVQNL